MIYLWEICWGQCLSSSSGGHNWHKNKREEGRGKTHAGSPPSWRDGPAPHTPTSHCILRIWIKSHKQTHDGSAGGGVHNGKHTWGKYPRRLKRWPGSLPHVSVAHLVEMISDQGCMRRPFARYWRLLGFSVGVSAESKMNNICEPIGRRDMFRFDCQNGRHVYVLHHICSAAPVSVQRRFSRFKKGSNNWCACCALSLLFEIIIFIRLTEETRNLVGEECVITSY